MLMGHSLGVSDSYVRFTEKEMLEDYKLGIDYLTVNQTVVLINKTLKKQEETIHKSLKEMEDRHRRELDGLHESYEKDMQLIRNEMQNKFQEIVTRMDLSKV